MKCIPYLLMITIDLLNAFKSSLQIVFWRRQGLYTFGLFSNILLCSRHNTLRVHPLMTWLCNEICNEICILWKIEKSTILISGTFHRPHLRITSRAPHPNSSSPLTRSSPTSGRDGQYPTINMTSGRGTWNTAVRKWLLRCATNSFWKCTPDHLSQRSTPRLGKASQPSNKVSYSVPYVTCMKPRHRWLRITRSLSLDLGFDRKK